MAITLDEITGIIIETSIKIQNELGTGLYESVYQRVLPAALARRGLKVEVERSVPFEFEGMWFDQGFKADLVVEDRVLVEMKSAERLHPAHHRQTLTYLRLLDLRVGLLINFAAYPLKNGIHRIVNQYVPDGTSPLAINKVALPDLPPE